MQLFNVHIFELEQAEYLKEGIEWNEIDWRDNTPTLDLIEGRPNGTPGILVALDDATWRASSDTDADANLLNELHASFAANGKAEGGKAGGGGKGGKAASKSGSGHPSYSKPKLGSSRKFTVSHYAGEVTYDVSGFVRKNSETLTPDVQELLGASSLPWLVSNRRFVLRTDPSISAPSLSAPSNPLSPTHPDRNRSLVSAAPALPMRRGSRLRQSSVGEQFRWQLAELINTVDASTVFQETTLSANNAPCVDGGGAVGGVAYVRCIKSNAERLPWTLDVESCAHQLRCAGMMEAVRIRRESFARRYTHETFHRTFAPAIDAATAALPPSQAASILMAEELAATFGEPRSAWQSGASKVFLRHSFAQRLASWSSIRLRSARRAISGAAAAWRARRHAAAACLQAGWAKGRARIAARLRQQCMARGVKRWAAVARSARAAKAAAATTLQSVARMRAAARDVAGRRATAARVDVGDAAAIAGPAGKLINEKATPSDAMAEASPPRMLGPGCGSTPVFVPAPSAPALIRGILSDGLEEAPASMTTCLEDHVCPPTALNLPTVPTATHNLPTVGVCVSLSELPAGGLQKVVSQQQKVAAASPRVSGRGLAEQSPRGSVGPGPAAAGAASKPAGRSVEQLGPRPALCVGPNTSVAEAAREMVAARVEAVLVMEGGSLRGILTATDVARRVVAAGREPRACTAADAMTRSPQTVLSTDAADTALTAMISGSFRHVPVLSPNGGAPAILDLVRCLFDVIRMLERAQAAGEALIDAVSRRVLPLGALGSIPGSGDAVDGASGSASELLAPALRTLLAPSLRSLASSCPAPAVVGADATLVEAAKAMLSPGVTAVLVRCPEGADGGAGGGAGGGKGSGGGAADAGSPDEQRFSLLTPRSLLEAVAEGDAAALASSALDGTGGAEPLLPPSDCSVLDALHMLQAERRTHALLLADASPADEADASPVALLDMLQLVRVSVSHAERSADAQQLHAFWGAAAALSEVGGPEAGSKGAGGPEGSAAAVPASSAHRPPARAIRAPGYAPTLLGDIGEDEACDEFSDTKQSTLVSGEGDAYDDGLTEVRPEDSISMAGVPNYMAQRAPVVPTYAASAVSMNMGQQQQQQQQQQRNLHGTQSLGEADGTLLLKFRDSEGSMHRVRCLPRHGWRKLEATIHARLGVAPETAVRLLYCDDDGDEVAIDSDDTLLEAAAQATRVGNRLNVTVTSRVGSSVGSSSRTLQMGASVSSSSISAAAGGAPSSSAVSSFLGGLLAASSLAVGAGIVLAAKAAKR